MVLLSAEKGLKAEEIVPIVRESYITVLRWLKRYIAEGVEGLMDAPRSGWSTIVTQDYHKRLTEIVRRRPRSLAGIRVSVWRIISQNWSQE